MLTDVVLLRGRYRTAFDTLALEADLSEHRVIATVRQDRDVDQVVEWARLAGHPALVLHRATLVGVGPLEGMALLTALPPGAASLVELLREVAVEEGAQRCELERRVTVSSLALAAPRLRHPSEHVPQTVALRAPVVEGEVSHAISDDELLMRTAAGSARTRAAVRELLACREHWPGLQHSGALMNAWEAVACDDSLGDERFHLTEELYALARSWQPPSTQRPPA
jgi:hypothetical protein